MPKSKRAPPEGPVICIYDHRAVQKDTPRALRPNVNSSTSVPVRSSPWLALGSKRYIMVNSTPYGPYLFYEVFKVRGVIYKINLRSIYHQ